MTTNSLFAAVEAQEASEAARTVRIVKNYWSKTLWHVTTLGSMAVASCPGPYRTKQEATEAAIAAGLIVEA